jgi:hypothetical protein
MNGEINEMIVQYLLKEKQHVVDLCTTFHSSYGVPAHVLRLMCSFINWKICDLSGFPLLDVSDKARFTMLHDPEKELYYPTIEDFECFFEFPVICTIEQSQEYAGEDYTFESIKVLHLHEISRLAHPYPPVPYNWIRQMEKLIIREHMQKSPNLTYLVKQMEETYHPGFIFHLLEHMLHGTPDNMLYDTFLEHIKHSRHKQFIQCVVNVIGDTDPYYIDRRFKEHHTWNDVHIMEHIMNNMIDHANEYQNILENQNV